MARSRDVDELMASLRNPRHASVDGPGIEFDGVFQNKNVTFVAHPNDIEEHGRQIYERAQRGDFGKIGNWAPTLDSLKFSTISVAGSTITNTFDVAGLTGNKVRMIRTIGKMDTVPAKHQDLVAEVPAFTQLEATITLAISALSEACNAAKSVPDLQAALKEFSTDFAEAISVYNAASPAYPITPPSSIYVPGL
jgi:hypothetical protein